MAGGYMGRLLFVNLGTGEMKEESPDESLYRDFIGGYGVGARILYSRQRGGAEPLGPENTLGLVTGPLTGTPATFGCRFVVVAKSPLTGGWGDANCGGEFGPYLKFAGYDGVFINGISEKPVYLLIDNGKAELRDAAHLWGKTNFETDDMLLAEHGNEARVVSIGPAGEKLLLVSCLITHKGTAAGRSGMGAVMGSKKLKAVVVKGDQKVPIADIEAANRLRSENIAESKQFLQEFGKYGTGSHAEASAHSGDTPVKNWGGIGIIDLPDASGLNQENLIANMDRRTGCWHCPAACKALLKEGAADYNYPAGTRRPEYETLAAFGAMCLNSNIEVIAMANYLCNIYGLDTIFTGTIIAFAMECYEHGIITRADTDGIELTWGNPKAMFAVIEKIAHREGIGDILADGVKVAAERIGRGAEEYAVHIGGQELGLHDPKFDFPVFAGIPTSARFKMDATPGRHTVGFGPPGFRWYVINAAGLCLHSNISDPEGKYIARFMSAVTGWERSMDELLKAGERIANMRHVFTLREGDNPLERKVHGRIIGRPPQKAGPLAGVTTDLEAQVYWNLGALDWNPITTRPSRKKLLELGLNDVAQELWPPQETPGFGPG
jgi:aldehyde:ferredoxin oxidoreductase